MPLSEPNASVCSLVTPQEDTKREGWAGLLFSFLSVYLRRLPKKSWLLSYSCFHHCDVSCSDLPVWAGAIKKGNTNSLKRSNAQHWTYYWLRRVPTEFQALKAAAPFPPDATISQGQPLALLTLAMAHRAIPDSLTTPSCLMSHASYGSPLLHWL